MVHNARMSHVLHFVLVPTSEGHPEGAAAWAEMVPDAGATYDWMAAWGVIRPDGTIVKLVDNGGYGDYLFEDFLADLQRTIAEDSGLSLPVLDESSSSALLRDAASVLLRRASAREALDSCVSPEAFSPWTHEFNSWEWGQLGVTHPWIEAGDKDLDRCLLILDFHS